MAADSEKARAPSPSSIPDGERPGSASSPSAFAAPKPGKIVLTRMQLLEYMHQRAWWRVAQVNLIFTLVLWGTFLAQIYLRASVTDGFKVKDGIVQHVEQLVAHPSVSGVPFMAQNEVEVPCRCACRSMKKGTPPTVCGTEGAEVLDFAGNLGPANTASLLASACDDVPKPLADLQRYVSWNMSNYSCPEWFGAMGEALGSAAEAQGTLCTASRFEAFLHHRSTAKEWVNDTDNHILYQLGDFSLARWRCPSMCGACTHDIAHGMRPLTWAALSSVEDVWLWLEHGLLPDIFEGKTSNPRLSRPGVLARRNLLIGGLRVRQMRRTQPVECDVGSSLQQLYLPRCRSREPAAAYATGSMSELQRQLLSSGVYSAADTDEEGAFDAFFEVERDRALAMDLATQLRQAKWLDSATHSLRLEGLALNAESGFFALVTATFDFGADGMVTRHLNVETLQIISKVVVTEYIPEFIWLGLIAWLLLQELWQVLRMCWQRKLREYFTDGWNLVDWFSILLGVAMVGLWVLILLDSTSLAGKVVDLPRVIPTDTAALKSYRTSWTGLLDDARALRTTREAHLFMMFVYSSIITLRFMKGFLGQQKLAMIQNSLAWASKDVLHFQIVFVVLFATFVLGGHVLFGVALKEWSTVTQAFSSTIKMLMGAFEFEAMFEYAPWSATVWFWLFLFTMIFSLLRLLTAMLVVHFGKFRRMVGPTDTIFSDAWEGFRDLLWRTEWRWDNIMMREFMGSLQNPYDELIEGVAEKARVPDEMQRLMDTSVLGVRLAKAEQDVKSIYGLSDENKEHPSIEPVKEKAMQKELRTIGADATVADHLIYECDKSVKKHSTWAQRLQNLEVERARFFLRMLRDNGEQLAGYCEVIENGVHEEMTSVIDGLEVLEASISEAFEGLLELRQTEVDSLALCPPRLPYAGTSVRDTFMTCLGHQPPRKGTAPVPGREGLELRLAGEGDELYALGNDFGLGPGSPERTAVPAALLDNGPGAGAADGGPPEPDPDQLALDDGQEHEYDLPPDPTSPPQALGP